MPAYFDGLFFWPVLVGVISAIYLDSSFMIPRRTSIPLSQHHLRVRVRVALIW